MMMQCNANVLSMLSGLHCGVSLRLRMVLHGVLDVTATAAAAAATSVMKIWALEKNDEYDK